MRITTAAAVIIGVLSLASAGTSPTLAQECDNGSFDSTYDLIQEAIFENKGCTASTCHGALAAGGLDLRADVSYDNLVSQPALTVPDGTISGLLRVVPGQKDQSLLFLNLAAGTLPEQWTAPLRAMPIGLEPLSFDELDAVREWIEQGAPREGTVPGTGELLDACLPPAEPLAIEPLAPPAPGTGVQVKMPKWILDAHSEDEVCFTSYYDLTGQVPAEFLTPDGNFFRYSSNQIRQDPLSHHLIVNIYTGPTPPEDPAWGEYKCRGGDKDGETCPPTDLGFCGPDALCGSEPHSNPVCAGFGPNDRTQNSFPFAGIQEASQQQDFPPGTYRPAPVKGLIVWNSHAFNLTDVPGKIEGWLNFGFGSSEDHIYPMNGIFNVSRIFGMSVPPYGAQELCQHNVLPPNTRLYELNSHTHQRGKMFRTFLGRYTCQSGPNRGDACAPLSNGYEGVDACEGAPCTALEPPEFGDCNGDAVLAVGDLVTCVGIALESRPLADCPSGDRDGNDSISIAELVQAVRAALAPPTFRNPEEDLLYTNLVYNDPTVVKYEPAKLFPGPGSSAATRTLTYCSLWDNGFIDLADVKRRENALGRGCATPTGCTEGKVGDACGGATEEERNASCDTFSGAGDGFCDACGVGGGFTTEDEMFILMGSFYVEN
jgi:hypothetical protein